MSPRPSARPIFRLALLTLAISFHCAAQDVRLPPRNIGAVVPPMAAPSINVSPGNWSQLAQLSASGIYADFNSPVAISGDTAVMAQPPNVGQNSVIAQVFTKGPNGWRGSAPVANLTASISQEAYFAGVAIDGDTIVVTGPVEFKGVAGYAFVYVKPAGGWKDMTPTAVLSPSDTALTSFGFSASISGDTIAVGDPGDDNETTAGAVYVYVKPAGGWQNMTQTAYLTASDANVNDDFGYSVSVSGGTIAVGATQLGPLGMGGPGKSYVFVAPQTGWANMTQTAELTVAGAAGVDEIGFSIAADGDNVVVGAPNYNRSGAAFVYTKPESGWTNMTETATLTAGDGLPGSLGNSVALSGSIAIAGAESRGFPPNGAEGGIYVFEEPASGWQDASSNIVLTGSDAHYRAQLGEWVAISGKTLVGGSYLFATPATAFVFGLP